MFVLTGGSFIVVMMFMSVRVMMSMLMTMLMFGLSRFLVVMVVFNVDIELCSRDVRPLLLRNVQMVAIQGELSEVVLESFKSTPRSSSAPRNMSPLMPLKMSR